MLLFIFILSVSYSVARPQKNSRLDETANEVKSSRGGEGNLQIERTLDFNKPSIFNENIKNKLPDFTNARKKANKTIIEKQYDELGSLISEKKVLEEQSSIETQSNEINSIADRLKAINSAIQRLINEKQQASGTKILELNK